MKTKTIARGFIAFLLVAITMISLAYADHTIGVTAFWTENDGTSVAVEQGEGAEFFVFIRSTSDYTLLVELLRSATVVRTIVPGTMYPATLEDDASSHRINVDTDDLAGFYTLRIHAVNTEGDATAYLTLDVNTLPSLSITPDEYEVNEGETLRIMRIVGVDRDGDNLTYVARRVCNTLPYPSSLYCVLGNMINGPLDNNLSNTMEFNQENGQLNYSPGFGVVQHPAREEQFEMQFRAYDGEQFSAWEYVTITVHDVNRIPVITSDPVTIASENNLYEYDILAADADTEDDLTYTLRTAPAGMELMDNTIIWTPDYEQAGEHSVVVEVSDGIDNVLQEFVVSVENINRNPVLVHIPDRQVRAGEVLEFLIIAFDVDGEELTLTMINLPAGAIFVPLPQAAEQINRQGIFRWQPTAEQLGTYSLLVQVRDESNGGDGQLFRIKVTAANTAPVLDPIGDQTILARETLRFTITASDADGGMEKVMQSMPSPGPAPPTTRQKRKSPETARLHPGIPRKARSQGSGIP